MAPKQNRCINFSFLFSKTNSARKRDHSNNATRSLRLTIKWITANHLKLSKEILIRSNRPPKMRLTTKKKRRNGVGCVVDPQKKGESEEQSISKRNGDCIFGIFAMALLSSIGVSTVYHTSF